MKKILKQELVIMLLMFVFVTLFSLIKYFFGFEDMVMIGICTILVVVGDIMNKLEKIKYEKNINKN